MQGMRIILFTVSREGIEAVLRIHKGLCCGLDYESSDIAVYIKCKNPDTERLADAGINAFVLSGDDDLQEYVRLGFESAGALVFVCAAGIAVRMIAPFIVHKASDPAVIVMDEKLKFCIPILSGHLGGANELARRLASAMKAEAVITTASDLNGITAVDIFAANNGFMITDLVMAKEYTSALLNGETIYVMNDTGDVTLQPVLPAGYELFDTLSCGGDAKLIRIAYKMDSYRDNALNIVPRCLKIGIGCRKGMPEDNIEAAVRECFDKHGLYVEAIEGVYSIDIKKDEEGILSFCNSIGARFVTYAPDELKAVEGDYASSDFVKDVTGVDNVCERSAMMTGSRLLVGKEVYPGITLAVAV